MTLTKQQMIRRLQLINSAEQRILTFNMLKPWNMAFVHEKLQILLYFSPLIFP